MSEQLHSAQEARGARFRKLANADVARHYGDGAAEYDAVRRSAGIAVRSDLVPLRMWGRDPIRMLHGLVTNDLTAMTPEQGVYATMLTPKGRTIAEMRVFLRPEKGPELVLLMPREALEGTSAHLRKFVPPMFARWNDASEETGVLGVYGPSAHRLLRGMFGAALPPEDEEASSEALIGDSRILIIFSRDAGAEPGYDLVVPRTELEPLWSRLLREGEALGARPIGFGALETLRIEAGRPRYGSELTEETIPTEAFEKIGWMPRAISFTKGCYTGQEVIVRIAHRGHVNRQLRGLLLGDSPTPALRTPLISAETGKQVGWTASAATSPQLRQTIALGYVRREFSAGDTLRLESQDGPVATVVDLPFITPAGTE
ncbi:glycine cleavage T C-terminal barrel domain-containing protein [soil metagenome]